jgi:hypothetical protein
LIGEQLEADDLGPELQRAILIGGGNADELDMCDHARQITTRTAAAQSSSLLL